MSRKKIIKDIRRAYYAVMTNDEVGAVTYDPIVYLEGLREITVTPNEQSGEIYAEGTVWDQEYQIGNADVTFDVTDIAPEHTAKLLGKKLAASGGYIDNKDDNAPYIALMYEKILTDGSLEYATLFKGKLSIPEDKGKTREGNVEYQTKSVKGSFIPLLGTGDWRHVVRSTDTDFNAVNHALVWGAGKSVALPTVKAVVVTYTEAELEGKTLLQLRAIGQAKAIANYDTITYEALITAILASQA